MRNFLNGCAETATLHLIRIPTEQVQCQMTNFAKNNLFMTMHQVSYPVQRQGRNSQIKNSFKAMHHVIFCKNRTFPLLTKPA